MNSARHFNCPIRLTKSVQDAFKRFGLEDSGFLKQQEPHTVLIEKNKEPEQESTKILLYFAHISPDLIAQFNGKLPVLTAVMEDYVLTAVHVMLKPHKSILETNWRRTAQLTFVPDPHIKNPVPRPFREWLDQLEDASEKSAYVRKRIAGWEGYLSIQEQQADIADISFSFGELGIQKDFRRLTLYDVQLKQDDWRKAKDLDIKFPALGRELGKVLKVNQRSATMEIEVLPYMEDVVRKSNPERFGKTATLSNFASLSQIRRLRSGFVQLEKGQAENPFLEKILFEESPPVAPLKTIPKLHLHHPLNGYQRRAVEGAVAAEDVYVIQGPPGTGKTTVISEICLQNAKMGLRTLVASQSNLAVDNALSRLLANKDIRILRVGRTESIEEEGKKFIEENIGDYWRDVTLKTITSTVDERALRIKQVEQELATVKPLFEELQEKVGLWTEKAARKKEAQQKEAKLRTEYQERTKQMEEFDQQKQQFETTIDEALKHLDEVTATKRKEEEEKHNFPTKEELDEQLVVAKEKLHHVTELQQLAKLQKSRQQVKENLEETKHQVEELSSKLQFTEQKQAHLQQLRKVKDIQDILNENPVYQTPRVLFKLKGIEGIRQLMKTYHPAVSTWEQYSKALDYFTLQLGEKRRPIRKQPDPVYLNEELQAYLDQGRAWIKYRQLPDMRELSDYVQGLYSRLRYIAEIIYRYEELVARGENELMMLREELVNMERLTVQQELRAQQSAGSLLEELKEREHQLDAEWQHAEGDRWLEELELVTETTVFEWERTVRDLEKKQAHIAAFEERYAQVVTEWEAAKEQHAFAQNALTECLTQAEIFPSDIQRLEEELKELEPLLQDNPEDELEKVQKEWLSLQFQVDALEKENKDAPLKQKLQSQWQSLLEQATAEDVDEIRKLNVKYANVIGTTCVASARKDFVENYPSFDVVIIDEVSKATPPELLLPMLKGKKVILVGDHHQLPPLLGDDTLEEVLEQMMKDQKEFTAKQEIENLLKESLFERLYKNLPDTHKTMLAIQYRMHESIMQTITPFYRHDQHELTCGLEDSDVLRAHGLETPWLRPENHVLWVDLPHAEGYLEERVKGGKSLWNPSEMKVMKQALIDLNEAVKTAKEQGRYPKDTQKTVGVISFYGEQVKQLDRLIQQELRLPHITMRTGTVDRFQGMEMEVIILSMVRNHQEGRGDIGFANDYRRLNVALSRAKELLVLVGSHEMFTEKVKRASTKDMYQHVWNYTKQVEGTRTLEEVLGHVELSH